MRSTGDPQQRAVYAAEDTVIDEIGPKLTRWRAVEVFLESTLSMPQYLDRFPHAPLDVELLRRSRNATASLAIGATESILIRDGSWNSLTVLHELAHLIVAADTTQPNEPHDHGPRFVATELDLVRMRCGFDQYVNLRTAFDAYGVQRAW